MGTLHALAFDPKPDPLYDGLTEIELTARLLSTALSPEAKETEQRRGLQNTQSLIQT